MILYLLRDKTFYSAQFSAHKFCFTDTTNNAQYLLSIFQIVIFHLTENGDLNFSLCVCVMNVGE